MSALIVIIAVMLMAGQPAECAGISIVRNGLDAFARGEPRIGPYTNPIDYLEGGLEYIRLSCGDETAQEFEEMADENNLAGY